MRQSEPLCNYSYGFRFTKPASITDDTFWGTAKLLTNLLNTKKKKKIRVHKYEQAAFIYVKIPHKEVISKIVTKLFCNPNMTSNVGSLSTLRYKPNMIVLEE